MSNNREQYSFHPVDGENVLSSFSKEDMQRILRQMLRVRHFETRAEAAYQQGHVGGFFHAYSGQEAIQTAAVEAIGKDKAWWITTYRCHAMAILLGEDVNELMAELYGKETGNARGRGGSMHLYSDRMLGGFGIVGGHVPIAAGAAFRIKYMKEEEVAICFLGDGAVAQGAFHESMNLASLWNLPLIVVIENNQWGMGTAVKRAICVEPIAEHFAKAYNIPSMTLDGMDFLSCAQGFKDAVQIVKKQKKPILIEAVTERFKGHSVSDPAFYRSKEELKGVMEKDPILLLKQRMMDANMLSEDEYQSIDKEEKDRVVASMKFAEESPLPNPATLEEDVFAPEDRL